MIVWLASYPRSGNTFLRVVLNSVFGIKTYSIYDDKNDIGSDKKTSEMVGHEFLPENFDIQQVRDEEKVYYIKTHELLDDKVDENDKIIYLIRDGRESTLSFTKHQNTFAKKNKKLIDTIYGNTFIGSWGDHVISWSPKNRDNTLLIKFEKLTKNPIEFIKLLSDFLGVKPIGNTIPSFEELKKINPKFFRSGKTNSWENVYTDEEHIAFWVRNHKAMDEHGYDYKKPEIFNEIENHTITLESVNQNNYLINLVLTNTKELQIANHKLTQKQNLINHKHTKLLEGNKALEETERELEETNKVHLAIKRELEEKQKVIHKQALELQTIYTSKKYKLANIIASPYTLLKQMMRK